MLERMEDRWRRRRNSPELILEGKPTESALLLDVRRTVEIAACPHEVWDFVHAPQTAALTDPTVIRGYTLPGVPAGQVGERQCFEHGSGGVVEFTTVIEVLHIDLGHRAAFRTVPDNGWLSTTSVTGAGRQSVLEQRSLARILSSVSQADLKALRSDCEARLDAYLTAVRQHVEAGWRRGRHAQGTPPLL